MPNSWWLIRNPSPKLAYVLLFYCGNLVVDTGPDYIMVNHAIHSDQSYIQLAYMKSLSKDASADTPIQTEAFTFSVDHTKHELMEVGAKA